MEMELFNFYENQDSVGGDIIRLSSEDACLEYCKTHPKALGFNTFWFVKSKITTPDKFIDTKWNQDKEGLYVKKEHDPVQKTKNAIMDSTSPGGLPATLPITFTVTTCKRLKYFIKSMNAFLVRCKDAHLIRDWLCVDDNSSEEDRQKMRDLYPFFKFICKTPENKGHAKSMNIMWDEVKTPYVLQFEDDWLCREDFYIEPCLKWLGEQPNQMVQLLLRKIDHTNNNVLGTIGDKSIVGYEWNFYHQIKPQINRKYDSLMNYKPHIDFENIDFENADSVGIIKGWWWPGLSLNPGIINIETLKAEVGRFNEIILPELFEYDYSFRTAIKNFRNAYIPLNIHHIGDSSSYVLNGEWRSHD